MAVARIASGRILQRFSLQLLPIGAVKTCNQELFARSLNSLALTGTRFKTRTNPHIS